MRNTLIVAFSIALISLVPRIARAGCEFDSQCKGDRVCEAGVCVAPPAPAPTPAQTTCGADTDCAGDAICEQGVCHAPTSTQAAPTAAPTAAPAPATQPPVSAPAPAAPPIAAMPPKAESPAPPTNTPGQPPGPPIMDRQLGLTGFLSPAGETMFLGLQADVSMASKGVARSPMLGASLGMGWRGMPMGDTDVTVSSFHAAAWVGYQAKVNPAVTYRVKGGGLMIRDSLDQFGGGGFLAGEIKFGKFLTGLDLWLTASADLVVRIGLEL